MPTITRCRIASDVDFLSRVQLEEVSRDLKKHCPRLDIETVAPRNETAADNNRPPNSPIRVAHLMITKNRRRIYVQDEDKLVGIIYRKSILVRVMNQ